MMGVPSSQVRVCPPPDLGRGTPHPDLEWGYPHADLGPGGHPHQEGWGYPSIGKNGVPPVRKDGGTHPLPSGRMGVPHQPDWDTPPPPGNGGQSDNITFRHSSDAGSN